MKTKEKLNALKNEVESLNKKLAELSEDELNQVIGGAADIDIRKDLYENIILSNSINGLMSDKPHPGYVTAADRPKDPGTAQRQENCSKFL